MASYHEMDGEASCRRHGEIIQPSRRGLQTRIPYFKTASLNMDAGCWRANRQLPPHRVEPASREVEVCTASCLLARQVCAVHGPFA